MKKDTTGVAGAARIYQMTLADLAREERHGKRRDVTGKSRAINDQAPLTTTGLELRELFRAHIGDAFVPKCTSKAMHLLLQYPTDLVDGEDAVGMLRHGRDFAARVFGDRAIVADRVDRDEKSKRVVDLIIVPKYVKKTKHEQKEAVGMTHHLKKLALQYGEKTGPHGCGRALQTAWYEYMRDVMKLEGVVRGSPKAIPGPDWKSAEQQRVEELDAQAAELHLRAEQLKKTELLVQGDQLAAAAAIADAARVTEQAEADHRIAQADLAAAARDAASRQEELTRRELQLAEREQMIATREAEAATTMAQAKAAMLEADRARATLDAALKTAQLYIEESVRDRVKAKEELAAAEADRARAAADLEANSAEGKRIDAQRKLEQAQLELLARGMDDTAGLELRPAGSTFSMRKAAMGPDELVAYQASWLAPLIRLGRRLADAMEQVRSLARKLVQRERELNERAAALMVREQDADRDHRAREAEHAAALAELQRRNHELDVSRQAVSVRAAEVERRIAAAAEKEAKAEASMIRYEGWALAVDAIIEHPEAVDVSEGRIQLDQKFAPTLDPKHVAILRETPPVWALNVILARLEVADRHSLAEKREADAAQSARQLAELVSRAGPILAPDQQKVAAEARESVQRSAAAAQAWNAARSAGR